MSFQRNLRHSDFERLRTNSTFGGNSCITTVSAFVIILFIVGYSKEVIVIVRKTLKVGKCNKTKDRKNCEIFKLKRKKRELRIRIKNWVIWVSGCLIRENSLKRGEYRVIHASCHQRNRNILASRAARIILKALAYDTVQDQAQFG